VEPSGAPWRVLESSEAATGATGDAVPARARPIPWLALAVGAVALVVAAIAVVLTFRPEPLVGVDGADPYAAAAALGATVGPSTAPGGSAGTGGDLVVAVAGAVAHPGLYRLPARSRVGDAIAAAGGFAGTVDAAGADRDLNLAAIVHDGDKVRVPMRGEPAGNGATTSSPPGGDSGGGPTALIDLNRATAEQLDTLPGVGPATAAKIIAAREQRPFASIDDLGARKVVGAATLEKLRPLVTVAP
jgi:competence protein ComEA